MSVKRQTQYFVALSAIFDRTETVSWVEMEFPRSFFQFQARFIIRERSSRIIITLRGIEKSFKELQFQPRKKFQFCQKQQREQQITFLYYFVHFQLHLPSIQHGSVVGPSLHMNVVPGSIPLGGIFLMILFSLK